MLYDEIAGFHLKITVFAMMSPPLHLPLRAAAAAFPGFVFEHNVPLDTAK